MVDLFCAVVGDGRIFPVEIDLNKSVGHLKEAILEQIFDLIQFGAPALTLYLARRGDTWLNDDDDDMIAVGRGDTPDTIKTLMANHMRPLTELSADKYFGKNFTPGDRDIHVLIQLPNTKKRSIQAVDGSLANSTQLSRARTAHGTTQVVDASSGWFERFHASSYASNLLPASAELGDLVASPLPEKICLDGRMYKRVAAAVDQSIVDKMFVLDERAACHELWEMVFLYMIRPHRRLGTTAKAFIGFWDSFICRPLHVLFEQGAVDRFDPWTGAQRPDMVLRMDQICVFRGQEADPHVELRVPSQALRDKLVWLYGDTVPYVFGYAASGFHCALYAMHYSSGTHKVETTQLGVYETDDATRRFEFVLALLQLTRLFRGIVELCPASAKREFDDLVRANGVVVRLNPTHVVKDFSSFKADSRFAIDSRALINIYEKLRELAVPHTDRLDHVSSSGHELTFKPRGLEMKPTSLEELFAALECVLTALEVLHKAGWMHRDISWANVMKYRGPTPAWFLIDFAEAAPSPQAFPSGTHLTRAGHAPEIFVEGGEHTTAVDMWSVGRLIDEWDGQMVWQISPARNHFMVSLLHPDPTKRPTAAQALKQLEQLKESSHLGHMGLGQHAQGAVGMK